MNVAPAAPISWLDPKNKVVAGQLWKLTGDVLSYTDSFEHKPVSYRISRPLFWRRWAACLPPQFNYLVADVSGWWIWIADDRREAKLFDLSSSDHLSLIGVSVPVDLVVAEEAGKP